MGIEAKTGNLIGGIDRAEFINAERIRELIRQSGLAAIVVQSPENVPYFSGFYNMDLAQIRSLHFVIWPGEGEPVLITSGRGSGFGKISSFIADVRTYDYWRQLGTTSTGSTPVHMLSEALGEKGLARSRIGLEMGYLPAAWFQELEALMPAAKFTDCGTLAEEGRMIKTQAEIDHLHWAARATDKAIRITYEMARPGDTEKDVADMLGYAITRLGADQVAFNVVASGERIIDGHHYAERVPLKRGDLFRVDYGGLFSGYSTDIARMAVVGKPSDRQRSTYEKVVELQRRMVERIRPGAIPKEIVERSLQEYEELGLPPDRPLFGHGIGLHVHEMPYFNVSETRPLEANTVICVEHGWADQATPERYHVEDTYLITEEGTRLLSDYASIDHMYVIE